ncbi:MAG: hypothetical protein ACRDZO_04375 [Egibacteraceae bacterium]
MDDALLFVSGNTPKERAYVGLTPGGRYSDRVAALAKGRLRLRSVA